MVNVPSLKVILFNGIRLTDLILTDFIPLGFLKSFCQLMDSDGFDKACLTLSTTSPAQIEHQALPTTPSVDKHNPMNFDNHTKRVERAEEQEASSVLAMVTLCGVVGTLLVVVSAVLMITSSRCLKSKEQR